MKESFILSINIYNESLFFLLRKKGMLKLIFDIITF